MYFLHEKYTRIYELRTPESHSSGFQMHRSGIKRPETAPKETTSLQHHVLQRYNAIDDKILTKLHR